MKITSPKNLAVFGLIFLALSYVLLTVSVRYLDEAFSPGLAFSIRIIAATIISYIIFYRSIDLKKIKEFSFQTWLYFILFGFFGYTVAIYLLSLGILKSSVLTVSVILGLSPIWTYLLKLIFKIDSFNPKILFFAIISVIGIFFLSNGIEHPNIFQGSSGEGVILIILASLLLSLFFAFRNKLPTNLNSQEISFVILAISSVTSLLLMFTETNYINVDKIFTPQVVFGLICGSLLNVTANVIGAYSFKHLNAVLGTQILMLENVFALIIGYFFFREYVTLFQVVGILLVVLGAYMVSLEVSEKG